ncbi:MAG: hypothetical protein CMI19_01555 [Opitutae bacterium]|nr:hypothetical protein [Opitutae bacterium]|tara:strand:+ start:684 stop:1106 length:423 start_codon:yes stop_codon:yes gene_type:complete
MIFDIIKVFVSSAALSFPFAAINAYYFHLKGLSVNRFIFTIFAAFFVSTIITYLCLMMKYDYSDWGFIFYIVGFFTCTPYFITSRLKVSSDVDHLVDLVGMITSIGSFSAVIFLWDSFFSYPNKAGFIFEFADFFYMLFK